MRKIGCFILVLFLASLCRAQEEPKRAQVNAAVANAMISLRDDVYRSPITAKVSVKDLIDRTGSADALEKVLARAEQIGGPRWVDEQTCQVRLELGGAGLAKALEQIAGANAKKSPVSSDVVVKHLRDWDKRVFSATGTSTASGSLLHVRPPEARGPWIEISEGARKRAMAEARQNAVQKVIESLGPIELEKGKTVGDAIVTGKGHEKLAKWLSDQPVALVDFREDRQVEVTLSARPGEVFDEVRSSLGGKVNLDEEGWGRVKQEIFRKMAPPVGLGRVSKDESGLAAVAAPAVNIPRQPPKWVDRQLDAEAVSDHGVTKLKAARQAEKDALGKLQDQVNALVLTPGTTIGEAAKHDGRFRDAVNRAMSHARTYKADYRADGSVLIKVSIDLRDIWQEIQPAP